MNEDAIRERFRAILAEELPDVLPAESVAGIAARLARAAGVGEIVEIAYQDGKCTRCGKDVSRPGPDGRWTDFYGRDRCRASGDDDQCDVARVRDGVRHAQLREVGHNATVTLEGAGGEVVLRQTLPAGAGWAEGFPEPILASGISVQYEKARYRAEVTPEDLAALGLDQR